MPSQFKYDDLTLSDYAGTILRVKFLWQVRVVIGWHSPVPVLHLRLPHCVIFTTKNEMSQQRKKPDSSAEHVVDEAKVHMLRQYNNTDGHFSLVRFVDSGSRDLCHTRGSDGFR